MGERSATRAVAGIWRRNACALAFVGFLGASSGCATLLVTGAVEPTEAAEQAAEIAASVTQALSRDGSVDVSDVRVAASGAVVTLNGSVPSQSQRDRAVAVAGATEGVSRVVDRLSISGT